MCVANRVIDLHEEFLKHNQEFNSIPADQVPLTPATDLTLTLENSQDFEVQITKDFSPFSWRNWLHLQPTINRMIQAFMLACLLHAVPMIMATVICYLTPTKGVGCCSLPVLVVFGASFVSAVLLIFSNGFSTFCMRYDYERKNIPSASKRRNSKSFSYWLAAVLSAVLRTLGKTIAYLNAIALLVHCTFSFAGVYHNCYCNSSRIGLGSRAYAVFLTGEEIRDQMVGIWGGCLSVVLFALVASTFYLVASGRQLVKSSR